MNSSFLSDVTLILKHLLEDKEINYKPITLQIKKSDNDNIYYITDFKYFFKCEINLLNTIELLSKHNETIINVDKWHLEYTLKKNTHSLEIYLVLENVKLSKNLNESILQMKIDLMSAFHEYKIEFSELRDLIYNLKKILIKQQYKSKNKDNGILNKFIINNKNLIVTPNKEIKSSSKLNESNQEKSTTKRSLKESLSQINANIEIIDCESGTKKKIKIEENNNEPIFKENRKISLVFNREVIEEWRKSKLH